MTNDVHGTRHAAISGRQAFRQGMGRDSNPYATWTPRGGVSFGLLGEVWLSSYNREAGAAFSFMTPDEFATMRTRTIAERAAYDATRDPAAAARTAARRASRRRAAQRRRDERGAMIGMTITAGPHGDRAVPLPTA